MRKILLAIIFIVFLVPNVAGAETKRVLLLSSYHPGFPTFPLMFDGLKDVLDPEGVKLDVEFMDSKRFFDKENYSNFTRLLKYKLENLPPYDVLVVSDDNALNYAIKHKDDLFKALPIVFLGVNNEENGMRFAREHGVTGVLEKVSMEETVGLMRVLLPDMGKIILLTDGTVTSQIDAKRFKEVMKLRGDHRYSVFDLSRMLWADVPVMLQQLSPKDAILLLASYRDMVGETKAWDEGSKIIIDNAPCPIFHMWEHGLGDGVMGGKVVSFHEKGRLAGELALKILEGTSASLLPVISSEEANVIILDANVLDKFEVPPFRVPEESVLLNYEPTFLEEHGAVLVRSGAVVIFLVLIITYLLKVNRARSLAEKQALESEERYRTYMESAPVGVLLFDTTGDIVETNEAMAELTGYSKEELTQMDVFGLLPADHREEAQRNLQELLETSDYANSYELCRKDGSSVFIAFHGVLMESGTVLGFCKDLSKEKKAHDALEKSEAMFRGLLEQAGDAVMTCDKSGRILFANDRACRNLGYTRDELIELKTWDIDPKAGNKDLESLWKYKSVSLESVHIRKDGSELPVEMRLTAVEMGGSEIGLCVARDISDRKSMEEEKGRKLLASKAYTDIFKALTSPDSTIQSVSDLVFQWALDLTDSKHAMVGAVEPPELNLHIYAMSKGTAVGCDMDQQDKLLTKCGGTYPALWGDSLNTGKTLVTNFPMQHPLSKGVPDGHIHIEQFMSVPCWYEGEIVGQISLANSPGGYSAEDQAVVENLANLFALAVYRKRVESELVHARKAKWY